jgi:alkaline phosphatase D
MTRVILYYQTFRTPHGEFISLDSVLYPGTPVTHIHLAAIHFGVDSDNTPYIHLNNRVPSDIYFNPVWKTVQRAVAKNIKIVVMIGGAGGGYASLFSDFNTYYKLLVDFLHQHPYISGVDLDIEEKCDISNIKKLINKLVADFGEEYLITVAPVEGALSSDTPGMGGFCYKELLHSPEGSYLDYLNCQAYNNYSLGSLDAIVNNGYNVTQIVMGMISGQDYKTELAKMVHKYGNRLGGVFIWEYFNAIPSPKGWVENISQLLTN